MNIHKRLIQQCSRNLLKCLTETTQMLSNRRTDKQIAVHNEINIIIATVQKDELQRHDES